MKRQFGLLVCFLGAGLLLSGCDAVKSVSRSIESSINSIGSESQETEMAANSSQGQVMAGQSLVANLPENCPQLKVMGDLSRIAQFSDPKSPKPMDMIASARLSGIDATCSVASSSVTLEISLDFDGDLGPVGKGNEISEANYTYPYFLTVISPNGQIMSKDVFALSMVYSGGADHLHKQDRLRQTIPLMAGQSANQFQIVAGFQLSPEELEYNRKAP